ncbi:MAG: hypothetical protein CMH56_13185 [Myxococcales bacterium]|nr:hypothetical protein [Myxococcales bacterium]|tara:strand:+ start:2236 stop:3207 length:972 start_codon:yes stop_codon:yes gene_type:complete
MRHLTIFVFGFSLSLLHLGCDDKPLGPEGGGHSGGGHEPIDSPTLCDVVEQVMPSCYTCHAAGATPPELTQSGLIATINTDSTMYAGETFVIPGNSEASLLYKKIAFTKEDLASMGLGQPMPLPAGGLSDDLIAMVKAWIDDGAKTSCEQDEDEKEEETNPSTDAGAAVGSGTSPDAGDVTSTPTSINDGGSTPSQPTSGADAGLAATVDFCNLQNTVLLPKCADCHNNQEIAPDLTLDGVFNSIVNVSSPTHTTQTFVVPGDPEASLLYVKVAKSAGELTDLGLGNVMPMTYTGVTSPLSTEDIQAIETWISQGAQMPASCD